MPHFELRNEDRSKRIRLVVPYKTDERQPNGQQGNWKRQLSEALAHAVGMAEATELARHRAAGSTTEYFLEHATIRNTESGHEVRIPTIALPNYVREPEQRRQLIQAAANYLRHHYIEETDGLHIYM